MRLHELFFGNLVIGGFSLADGLLKQKIESTWGTYENWEKEFRGIATMRGIGWVILSEDIESGALFNIWINEHDGGHLVGTKPLLVMDVFEHAFMVDYGLKRADYINACINAIDWKAAEGRV